MVFTANAALIINNKAYLSNFRYPQRTLERRDVHAHCCDMTEFIKAGGACKCLCLVL